MSVEELLLKSLKNLETEEHKEFQWFLKSQKQLPASELENADRIKTVDKMVAHFGQEEAVKITVEILRKISQNNLAVQLENDHKKGNKLKYKFKK